MILRQPATCLLPFHVNAMHHFSNLSRDRELKDGAYYCYCAYVLRISRFSDFLSAVLTNTGIIFFARFKTMRRKQNLPSALGQIENEG